MSQGRLTGRSLRDRPLGRFPRRCPVEWQLNRYFNVAASQLERPELKAVIKVAQRRRRRANRWHPDDR